MHDINAVFDGCAILFWAAFTVLLNVLVHLLWRLVCDHLGPRLRAAHARREAIRATRQAHRPRTF